MNLSTTFAALFLVATASFTSATSPPTTRYSSVCNQATRHARNAIADIFADDCANAYQRNFQRDVKDATPHRNGNNRQVVRTYNRCAKLAIEDELERIGQQCKRSVNANKECNYLGRTAASYILQDEGICPIELDDSNDGGDSAHPFSNKAAQPHRSDSLSPVKRFRRQCLKVAIGVCEGNMRSMARDCGKRGLRLRDQQRLQNKCDDEVFLLSTSNYVPDNWVEGGEVDEVSIDEEDEYDEFPSAY